MVHVKKVEIFGFKSFGFKNTTVQLEPGLISISGPNGSGKSNILDAIIFAMGENKARMMRADRLKSLIHDINNKDVGGNNSTNRIARSSVHFENSDRKIPMDSDTVEITREMDEQGESTYHLNKKRTTRNHIIGLLDVANAGLGQLNVVQQGTITRISEFSPEEKRIKIEDLIGLSSFDEQKIAASKNLENADRRLEIALAKMGEIKKRIDDLDEERNQKLRHDTLQRDLGHYKALEAAARLRVISDTKRSKQIDLDQITKDSHTLQTKRQNIREEEIEQDDKKTAVIDAVNAHTHTKASLHKEMSTVRERFESTSSEITVSTRRLEHIASRMQDITTNQEQINQKRDDIVLDIQNAKDDFNQINAKKKEVDIKLDTINTKRAKILNEQSETIAKRSVIDSHINEIAKKLNQAKLEVATTGQDYTNSIEKINEYNTQFKVMQDGLQSLAKQKPHIESLIVNRREVIHKLDTQIQKLEQQRTKIVKDVKDLEYILEKASRAATKYESKIKTVKGFMHEDYTVTKLKEDSKRLGILGLVYEIISWDSKYERAVMATSSDWIKAIIVKDIQTMIRIINVAKHRELPKFKIIPLDTIYDFDETLSIDTNDTDIIGMLADHIKCDPKYLVLQKFLFGNVVLTRTRKAAISASKKGYKAVTISGEYFEARGGTITIDINSKISKITRLIMLSSDVDELLESLSLVKKFIDGKKIAISKIGKTVTLHTNKVITSEKFLSSATENLSHLISNITSTKSGAVRLAKKISDLENKIKYTSKKKADAQQEVDTQQRQIKIAKLEYDDEKQSHIAKKIAQINQEKVNVEEMHTKAMMTYQDKSAKFVDLQNQDHSLASMYTTLAKETTALNAEQQELKKKISNLKEQRSTANNKLVHFREQEQQLISKEGSSIEHVKEYDTRLKELYKQNKDLTRDINILGRKSDTLKRDLQDLGREEQDIRHIARGLNYTSDEEEPYDVSWIIHELESEISALNSINARAPETYIEVSNGYRSISSRKNRLEGERNSIIKLIEKVDKNKKQAFLDAFDQVDKEIQIIFGKMTEGGNAWLELQDEDNVFESGISYMIQFPNKPKRESTSISGGEKTLAAVVFVLALQKLKPSPFYLFDEVDAHLDAPNTKKLANILEERAEQSQFIMVSLKDSIVEKARLIYGVFPKNGVSQVVIYKDKRARIKVQTDRMKHTSAVATDTNSTLTK